MSAQHAALIAAFRRWLDEDEDWARGFGCDDEHVGTHPNPGCRDRILADTAAKRAFLDHVERWDATLHTTPDGWDEGGCTAYRMAMGWSLNLLARAYQGRDGWDEVWDG